MKAPVTAIAKKHGLIIFGPEAQLTRNTVHAVCYQLVRGLVILWRWYREVRFEAPCVPVRVRAYLYRAFPTLWSVTVVKYHPHPRLPAPI